MSVSEDLLPAKEIAILEFNSLRGRLCTVIESAGLPQKQERALVLLIKNLSYQNQAVIAELIDRLENELSEYAMQDGLAGSSSAYLFRYNKSKLEQRDN